MKKVVVIATDLARLNAHSRVIERLQGWQALRKQSRLHMLGNFHFLHDASLGLKLLQHGLPTPFHLPRYFVKTDQRE